MSFSYSTYMLHALVQDDYFTYIHFSPIVVTAEPIQLRQNLPDSTLTQASSTEWPAEGRLQNLYYESCES